MRLHGTRTGRAALAFLIALLPLRVLADSPEESSRDQFKRTFQKTIALKPGQKLRIEHSNGTIKIRTQKESQVSISATIRVSSSDVEGARRFSEGIQISVEESPAGVSVVTRYPEKNWSFLGRGFVSYSVDYDIVMPETALLDTRNKFGNVDVSGLKASADIKNSNGSIDFRDGRGAQRLENSFGKIELARNDGNATVVNSNGSVTVSDLGGELDLVNRFGTVSASRLKGRSRISNSNGSV